MGALYLQTLTTLALTDSSPSLPLTRFFQEDVEH